MKNLNSTKNIAKAFLKKVAVLIAFVIIIMVVRLGVAYFTNYDILTMSPVMQVGCVEDDEYAHDLYMEESSANAD